MPVAIKTMTTPMIVYKNIFLAVLIFSVEPPEVINKIPAIINIKGAMMIAKINIKLVIPLINS